MSLSPNNISKGDFKELFVPLISLYLSVSVFEPLLLQFIHESLDRHSQGYFYWVFINIYPIVPLIILIAWWWYKGLSLEITLSPNRKTRLYKLMPLFTVGSIILSLLVFTLDLKKIYLIYLLITSIIALISWLIWNKALHFDLFRYLRKSGRQFQTDQSDRKKQFLSFATIFMVFIFSLYMLGQKDKTVFKTDPRAVDSVFCKYSELMNLNARASKAFDDMDSLERRMRVMQVNYHKKHVISFINPRDTIEVVNSTYYPDKYSNFIKSVAVPETGDPHTFYQIENIRRIFYLISRDIQYGLNIEEGIVKNSFVKLFLSIQTRSVFIITLILIVLIVILILAVEKRSENQSEGRALKVIIGCYLLLLIGMLKPVKAEYINLEHEGFMYTVSNWFAPNFIHDTFIGQQGIIDKYGLSRRSINGGSYPPPSEIFRLAELVEETNRHVTILTEKYDSLIEKWNGETLIIKTLNKYDSKILNDTSYQNLDAINQLDKNIDTLTKLWTQAVIDTINEGLTTDEATKRLVTKDQYDSLKGQINELKDLQASLSSLQTAIEKLKYTGQ